MKKWVMLGTLLVLASLYIILFSTSQPGSSVDSDATNFTRGISNHFHWNHNESNLTASVNSDATNFISGIPNLFHWNHHESNLTAFQIESPDVYSTLPDHFLDNYKSFCWYDKTDDSQLLCLPKVYLAGFAKCGSTELFQKLRCHPQITSKMKEYKWWTSKRLPSYENSFREPFSTYLTKLGPKEVNKDSVLIDGSPTLSWHQILWKNRYPLLEDPPFYYEDVIHSVTPAVKILMILRDPTERLWSDYLAFNQKRETVSAGEFDVLVRIQIEVLANCLKRKSLRSCCDDPEISYRNRAVVVLNQGIYICFVREWKEKFGDQMKVVRLEDYSENPISVLQDIFKFLDISPLTRDIIAGYISSSKPANTRRDEALDKGDMLPSTRKLLKTFYGIFNKELSKFLEDDRFLYGLLH